MEKKRKQKNFFSFFSLAHISKDERAYFIENISLLISSGMNIMVALEAIKSESKSKAMREMIDFMKEEIDAGVSLWKVLDHTHIFSTNVIALLRIGEETGRLSENFKVIISQERKDRVFKSKLRSAMLYPGIVFSLTVVIGVGITWFILPKLASVFSGLHLDLPILTRLLISVGTYLGAYGHIVIPLFIVVLFTLWYFLFIFKKTKHIGQDFLFLFPAIGKLVKEIEIARFGYMLGTLLNAGLSLTDSLNSLSEVTGIRRYQMFFDYIRKEIEEGNSFKKSFSTFPHTKKLIPVPIQQMIVAGEQSGNLAEILSTIGSIFEEKTEITTKNLSVILEPILLVIVWIGVAGIALAVILPLYSLLGGLNP